MQHRVPEVCIVKVFLITMAAVAALILFSPRPGVFQVRWPEAMPPSMSWDMITRARKASQHPAFCMYPWADKCRIG